MVDDDLCQACSRLYSSHYGVWAPDSAVSPGDPIKLSPKKIRKWLAPAASRIAVAEAEGDLVGYAIAIQWKEPKWGVVSWVTQLVVHTEYRNIGIAKRLMFAFWGFSSHYAWGLVSANPYAIRALEKATRRRCDPVRIHQNRKKLHRIGRENIDYVSSERELAVTSLESQIDTDFLVDRSELESMVQSATAVDLPWKLGALKNGWEWFAFTFQDQVQLELSATEVEHMLAATDDVVRQAYTRMALAMPQHKWAKHTKSEVARLNGWIHQEKARRVIDFGCGTGRHSVALADLGFQVLGIDFIEPLITKAREAVQNRDAVQFEVADCRTWKGDLFDVAVCLYDVIGSFADEKENIELLQNLTRSVSPGGLVILSVMSLEFTLRLAKHEFDLSKSAQPLLQLAASDTMEKSGNIFDPDHFIVDTGSGSSSDSQVVYRREQFSLGGELPDELVVRDRRYTESGIRRICRAVGLEVLHLEHVRAGWTKEYSAGSGKEILVVARTPTGQLTLGL